MEAVAGTALPGAKGSLLGRNSNRHWLRRQPLITVAAAAMAGILAAQTVLQSIWVGAAIATILGGWWCCSRHRRWGWLAATGCVAVAFGLRAQLCDQSFQSATVAALATQHWQPCVLRGTVAGPVERRPDQLAQIRRGGAAADAWQSVFDLRLTALRVGSQWRQTSGGARLIVSGDATHLLPGDRLQVLGQIQTIAPPSNPGGLDLRPIYRARHQQIRMLVDSPDHLHIVAPPSWTPARGLAGFGAAGERALVRHVGQQRAPLAAALVLGRREAVDQQQREKLLQTGTAHLLSVSGLHLGLVALSLSWLVVLLGLPRRQQILIILAGCVLYAALTGGRPPVLRAALLIATVLAGMWLGRPIHPLGALALAAVVLLTLNPANLTQVGVHLSFIAVGTLLLVSQYAPAASSVPFDPLDRLIESRLGKLRRCARALLTRLRLAVAISFWVWAITAPLVWYQFHIVSPISIIANVMLGIPLTVSLISGLLTVTVASVCDPLAAALGSVCAGGLDLMMYLIDRLAAAPYGHCWLPAPPAGWVMLFYGVTIGSLLLPERWPRGRLTLAWLAVWCAAGFWLIHQRSRMAEDTVEATFIDVGHGTAILIRHPTGGTWLYDCGRLGDPAQSARPIEAVLWSAGIRWLDGVILSHADADHYNALPALLRRFHIGKIVTPPGVLDTDEPGLIEVRRAVRAAGVPVECCVVGDRLASGDGAAWGRVLHPPPRRLPGSDNANSLVLQIDHGGRCLILPGDLERDGTESLLRNPRPTAGGVLMAPHHGSLQHDLRPLLDWCRPAEVIISGSSRADRPEVRQALAQKGSRVHLTAADGAIRVRIDRHGEIRIARHLHEPW